MKGWLHYLNNERGAIDLMPLRNVYPTMGFETLGQIATGAAPGPTPEAVAAGGGKEVEDALAIGGQASPLIGLAVFAALVVAIMWIAQRFGEPDGFRRIGASAYNVVLISLIAVAGIPVWKFLFTRFKVPGVSTWVHSV